VPLPDGGEAIPIGTGETLRRGERVALLGYGFGVKVALDTANRLAEHGISATVADARFVKPLDTELIAALAADHELLVTVEDNVVQGGFGSAVLEHLEDTHGPGTERARVIRVGLPDSYVTHGKPALLHEEVGLTGEAVCERVLSAQGAREPLER
jgi:1-deoxy-D-xylulose-5-phosphate synthase